MTRQEEIITGNDFRRMIAGAYQSFLYEYEYINSLNVFPVPDGDTGTNMLLTLGAVARTIAEAPNEGIGPLSRRAADSAILAARGNSGVILSQIFRGIARGLSGKEEALASELGKAFQYGILYAYRSVARPVEGTILTVAKGIAKGARRAVRESQAFADILAEAIAAGKAELERTPELLPVLKSAGVVDAGGQGLITFLAGCLEGLRGGFNAPEAGFGHALRAVPAMEADIAHPYCTEFIVRGCSIGLEAARQQLADLGDSLIVAEGDNLLKVHIHTAHPGAVLEAAIAWGSLHGIKIDNMADQHRHKSETVTAKSGLGIIAVADGAGLTEILHKMGAGIVVAGGQTMNPAVEDFVDAVHRGGAEKYIILPNNKNIVLAASQAQKLLDGKAEVVPTVNIPQGIAALLAFDEADSLEKNVARMTERIKTVKAGSIALAVRDSIVDGRPVAAGSYIGIIDNRVILHGHEVGEVLFGLVDQLAAAGEEIVTLYYGQGIDEKLALDLASKLSVRRADLDIEVYPGGQPHYHFIISAE